MSSYKFVIEILEAELSMTEHETQVLRTSGKQNAELLATQEYIIEELKRAITELRAKNLKIVKGDPDVTKN